MSTNVKQALKEERLENLKKLSKSAHAAERTNNLNEAYRLHVEAHAGWKKLKEDSTWWSTRQREDKRNADFMIDIHQQRITLLSPYLNGNAPSTTFQPLPSLASVNVVNPTQLITLQMTTEEQQIATMSKAISGVIAHLACHSSI
jgi:hypothetical protein